MSRDFTISIYKDLIASLVDAGFSFQTYHDFVQQPKDKVVLLRHDVDARNDHSLHFAQIQYKMGIVGTYYFRMVPQSFDEEVIREIVSMGHEIGYHYEDMDFANGDVDKAYELAQKHLAQLREVADVKTICMHGSPRSPYDNKEIWRKYDYRELGIIAEPYFDLDFSEVLYLTDTGRRWDGGKFSIRDRVSVSGRQGEWESGRRGELSSARDARVEPSKKDKPDSTIQRSRVRTLNTPKAYSTVQPLSKEYSFRSTQDIINACKNGNLPSKIMFNFHPQRWTDDPFFWTQELVWQNVKNVVKWSLLRGREWVYYAEASSTKVRG